MLYIYVIYMWNVIYMCIYTIARAHTHTHTHTHNLFLIKKFNLMFNYNNNVIYYSK